MRLFRLHKKAIGTIIASSLLFSSSVYAAVGGQNDGVGFSAPATELEIKALKEQFTSGDARNTLAANLLSKNYKLNEYELVILGETLRKELNEKNSAQTPTVTTMLKEHLPAYHWIVQNELKDAPQVAEAPKQEQKTQQQQSSSPSQQAQNMLNMIQALQNTGAATEKEPGIVPQQSYAQAAEQARTPQAKREAFSLLNVHPGGDYLPSTENTQETSVTPESEFLASEASERVAGPTNAPVGNENAAVASNTDLIEMANDAILAQQAKENKDFYIYGIHTLDYVKEHGTGNVPLRTDVTDDNGNYYVPKVTEQYQLEHAFEIGFGTRIGEFADIMLGVTIKNEDGLIGGRGTKWEFSSFHIVPRIKNPINGIKNETGVEIADGGRQLGVPIGHGTSIIGDTSDGDIGLVAQSKTGKVTISRQSGLQLNDNKGRYYFGLGKLSLAFSTYTLQLSECKAAHIGYRDHDQSLVFVVGRPQEAQEGGTNSYGQQTKGTYEKILVGAQYVTRNLLPNVQLAFNWAQTTPKGDLSNPNGAEKVKTSVYSVAFKSENMNDTEFQGEIARSVNSVEGGNTITGNADYLDISHRFSNRLSGTLHAVNIDGTFDASSLVEDRTGDYLYTTNQGDGKADYMYEKGQRGFDLGLQYNFPEDASIAFGYSRYPMTKNGNSMSDIFLAGNKSWAITDSDGNTTGELSVQQRFERRSVSNEDFNQNTSATTISGRIEPWKNAEAEANYQRIEDNAEGNQRRFDFSFEQNFYPLERVTITPKIEYQNKKGEAGRRDDSNAVDSSTLIYSLAIGYEIIPDELTITLLGSKEKYDVNQSEISQETGAKVDGEKRDILGVGLGLSWEPKAIPGLTASVSYRKDKVHYFTPEDDMSHQDIWEYSLEYSKPLGHNVKAAISYDYRTARDHAKPKYDEVTRTVSVSIDAAISKKSTLRLEHSYESEYKPLDPKATYSTQTTVARIYNSF